MELKLKLVKDDMLGSAIGELSSFSEMGKYYIRQYSYLHICTQRRSSTQRCVLVISDIRCAVRSPPARIDDRIRWGVW
eukprot:COSAG02_NODE_5276_length_4478_cov_1.851108_5_plen_78_part_00